MDLANKGISFAVDQFGTMVRLGWPSLILLLVNQLIFLGNGGNSVPFSLFTTHPDSWLLFWLAMLCYVLALTVFVPVNVLLCRIAARETEAPSGFLYFCWRGRETKFLQVTILLFLLLTVTTIGATAPLMLLLSGSIFIGTLQGIAVFFSAFGALIFCFLSTWFLTRACLIIPVAAIEDRLAPRAAFNMTKGHFWRLLGTFGLLVLVVLGVQFVLFFASRIMWLIFYAAGIDIIGVIIGAAVSSSVGFFVSFVFIGVAGGLWQQLNNPGSQGVQDAKFPD